MNNTCMHIIQRKKTQHPPIFLFDCVPCPKMFQVFTMWCLLFISWFINPSNHSELIPIPIKPIISLVSSTSLPIK